ncbi:DegV family protein [Mesobacillus harenae]|uniref:DegV family protein n=1 Tax=Mesobacillus harenae TaxID=2213203 RepID=UPI0015805268|nr:DegV family protein [Mesobacillus harenae]
MTKIKIVTDSTVDLSDEIIEKYGIKVVPLSLSINGETYLDRVDITPVEFMTEMKKSKELPKSSQPSAGEFLNVYDQLEEEGFDVISIHMTGGMSGTVQSAESAAKLSKGKVTVVDSRYISKGLAFQVIEAAIMADQGKDIEEIVARLNEIRKNTRLFVVVDTLENLVKGGRIGKGRAMMGSLLNIKPIASLEGGEYTPVSKARGHSQVIKFLTKQFEEDLKGRQVLGVGLVHADGYQLAERLKKEISNKTSFDQFEIQDTTPIISTHTGPGAIGFMYYFK